MAGGYSNLHRLFLQSLQSRSIVTMKSAVDRLREIVHLLGFRSQEQITEIGVKETIEEINVKTSLFGMEIKEILAEHNGEKFLVLVNTVDDSCILERIDHKYSLKEREVFRVLLEAIVLSGTYGSVSSTDALHLNVPNASLGPGAMQDLLDRLIADQWFIETNSGRIVPAPRCIAEFETYFKKNFHDNVQECPLCSNVVFYGVLCPHCDVITHKHCFTSFNSKRAGPNICPKPSCKKPISDEDGMENGVENGEDNEVPPAQRRTGSRRQRRNVSPETPQNTPAPMEDDDSQMEIDDGATPGPSRGRRKRRNAE